MKKILMVFAVMQMLVVGAVFAETMEVKMYMLGEKKMKPIGTITLTQTKYGTVFTPDLKGLPHGVRGFHIYENADCSNTWDKKGKTILGGAAGGHYDPTGKAMHGAPWMETSHMGDLPPIYINTKGRATMPVLAPRVWMKNLGNQSLGITMKGDTYMNKDMGGGGAMMACGAFWASKMIKK